MTNHELCSLCKLGIPLGELDKHIRKHANSDYENKRIEIIIMKKIVRQGVVPDIILVKPLIQIG